VACYRGPAVHVVHCWSGGGVGVQLGGDG
jgi:hypothetical protein